MRTFSTALPPHIKAKNSVRRMMLQVLLATIPALFLQSYFFGFNTLINILMCTLAGLAFESIALWLRQEPQKPQLFDGSVVVSAWLIAFSLPAHAPYWLSIVAMAIVVFLGKHIFGGIGRNLFNPAMLGLVALLVFFPEQLSQWPQARGIDTISSATPLADLQASQRAMLMMSEMPTPSLWSAWPLINLTFLIGGLYLMLLGIVRWHVPVAFLAGITVASGFFWLVNSDSNPSPLFHLLHGATMIGAFFIATDPVTSAMSPRGRLIYGFILGAGVLLIRHYGGYPEGLAFAVLAANILVPIIDQHSRPAVFGQQS